MVLFPITAFGQNELVTEINSKLMPIKSVESLSDFQEFAQLKSVLKDKRIVALGEATHGTHEFFTMKSTLIQYLVQEMGFKVFVLEADFAGAKAMNSYIIDGKGNPIDAMKQMLVGVWSTKDFYEMVEWMKKYNEKQTPENKIRFYGCDMQFAINSGAALLDGTVKFKNALSANCMKGIKLMINYRYTKIDKSQIPLLDATAQELKEASIVEEDGLKLALYQRYITCVLQTIEYAKVKYPYDGDIIRDQRMAENCEWIYNYEHNNKMIIWAHNLHVAKNITRNNNLPMGYYLNKKFPDTFYTIGFDFNKGEFSTKNTATKTFGVWSVPEVTSKKFVEYIFKQCEVPNFFLDFKSCQQNSVINEFLSKDLYARSIGAGFNPNNQSFGTTNKKLNSIYDGIIFINKTTAVEIVMLN